MLTCQSLDFTCNGDQSKRSPKFKRWENQQKCWNSTTEQRVENCLVSLESSLEIWLFKTDFLNSPIFCTNCEISAEGQEALNKKKAPHVFIEREGEQFAPKHWMRWEETEELSTNSWHRKYFTLDRDSWWSGEGGWDHYKQCWCWSRPWWWWRWSESESNKWCFTVLTAGKSNFYTIKISATCLQCQCLLLTVGSLMTTTSMRLLMIVPTILTNKQE